MKHGRKAQLETMEQIIVIFIVIIGGLIVFGIFFKISAGSSRVDKLHKLESSAVEIATLVSALPELQCTRNNVVTSNCVNKIKAETLSKDGTDADSIPDFIQNNIQYYHSIFGFSKITIDTIYPDCKTDTIDNDRDAITDEDHECLIEVYVNKPAPVKFTHKISLPVLIYDPSASDSTCFELGKGTCNYGYLSIEMYS